MRHALHTEQLTVLPKRFETAHWGGNFNFAAVNQNNYSLQASGISLLSAQANYQANVAVIGQS